MKDNLNKILFFPLWGWNPETKFKTDHIKIIYIFCKHRKDYSKIHVKSQRPPNNQSSLEKKKNKKQKPTNLETLYLLISNSVKKL